MSFQLEVAELRFTGRRLLPRPERWPVRPPAPRPVARERWSGRDPEDFDFWGQSRAQWPFWPQ